MNETFYLLSEVYQIFKITRAALRATLHILQLGAQ